jgi:7,8-dihydro-6-hydroxymethylpterin-pyrophosphokinase
LAEKVVYIALGSNVGDRAAMFESAIAAMNSSPNPWMRPARRGS